MGIDPVSIGLIGSAFSAIGGIKSLMGGGQKQAAATATTPAPTDTAAAADANKTRRLAQLNATGGQTQSVFTSASGVNDPANVGRKKLLGE